MSANKNFINFLIFLCQSRSCTSAAGFTAARGSVFTLDRNKHAGLFVLLFFLPLLFRSIDCHLAECHLGADRKFSSAVRLFICPVRLKHMGL